MDSVMTEASAFLSLCTAVLHGTVQRHQGALRQWPDGMWPMLLFPCYPCCWLAFFLLLEGLVCFKACNLFHARVFLYWCVEAKISSFQSMFRYCLFFKNGGSEAPWWGWPRASICCISGMVGFLPSLDHWISQKMLIDWQVNWGRTKTHDAPPVLFLVNTDKTTEKQESKLALENLIQRGPDSCYSRWTIASATLWTSWGSSGLKQERPFLNALKNPVLSKV